MFRCPILKDYIVDFITWWNFKTYLKGLFKNSPTFCFTDMKKRGPLFVQATQIIGGMITNGRDSAKCPIGGRC